MFFIDNVFPDVDGGKRRIGSSCAKSVLAQKRKQKHPLKFTLTVFFFIVTSIVKPYCLSIVQSKYEGNKAEQRPASSPSWFLHHYFPILGLKPSPSGDFMFFTNSIATALYSQ